MKFYWVNQGQTYKHQIPGGYMWSPLREKNNAYNRSWDLMRSVNPGDIIFSFADQRIKAIGIAHSKAYSFPKPEEFGATGQNWGEIGWRVDVAYQHIDNPIRPKKNIRSLEEFLPSKYSPIRKNGDGNQKIYLADISKQFALKLGSLIGGDILSIVRGEMIFETPEKESPDSNILTWENLIEDSITSDPKITDTSKAILIESRRGQGQFRRELLKIERSCRITGVQKKEHLIASHTKPWRLSSHEERLNPENGLMLTPNVDQLFDRGLITFKRNGNLVVSKLADRSSLRKMGIPIDKMFQTGSFSEGQLQFLDWHRESYFLHTDI